MSGRLWTCSEAEYHADTTRVSNSVLNEFRDGGAPAVADMLIHGIRREPTRAMKLGSALHCLTLEPAKLKERFGVDRIKDFDRRTKEGKAGYATWCIENLNTSKTWIDQDEMDLVHEQAEAIGRHKKAVRALSELPGLNEQAVIWEDETDLPMRGRLDRVLVDASLIVDLKTTCDFAPKEWEKASWDLRYHCQAALYLEAARRTWEKDFTFLFVCVSSVRPVRVAVREPDAGLLAIGWEENRKAIEKLARIRESGKWWDVEPFSAPQWARK